MPVDKEIQIDSIQIVPSRIGQPGDIPRFDGPLDPRGKPRTFRLVAFTPDTLRNP